HRLMLVMSSRSDFAPPWRTELCSELIDVGGLVATDVERLVRTLLGVPEVARPLVELLLEKSAGNPLYLEEIVRQLQETHALEVEEGRARLAASTFAVPETIYDIIAARVDRLDEPLKHTLQPAAVAGRRFAVLLVSPEPPPTRCCGEVQHCADAVAGLHRAARAAAASLSCRDRGGARRPSRRAPQRRIRAARLSLRTKHERREGRGLRAPRGRQGAAPL